MYLFHDLYLLSKNIFFSHLNRTVESQKFIRQISTHCLGNSLSNYILTTSCFSFFLLKSGIWCDIIFFILRAAPCKNKLNLLLVRFTVCIETCLPIGWRTNRWIYVWCVTGGNNAMVHTYDIRQIFIRIYSRKFFSLKMMNERMFWKHLQKIMWEILLFENNGVRRDCFFYKSVAQYLF